MPKWVAILPVYNEESHIRNLIPVLQKWVSEDMAERAVVCVDDGSTDKTREILERAGLRVISSDPLRHRNLGKAQAFAAGAKFADKVDAKIVVSLDADILDPTAEKITSLAREIERSKFNMLVATQLEPTVVRFPGSAPKMEYQVIGTPYTGPRAIKMSALTPLLNRNPKWISLFKGFAIEVALEHLIPNKSRSQVSFYTDKGFRKGRRKQNRQIRTAIRKIEQRDGLCSKLREFRKTNRAFAKNYLAEMKKKHHHMR
ncbi:MAG TPA: glycosyltransferase [Candidatus Diapherotrites archaeon]|uniref:Glycosyltransferase n=1 Tax=Candidatus Iainarchaeum sp. TaxID=3101447 RepID=A0A7J4J4I0_9ARCH|nr:glycosyltransferase [Candidatus Diapherotrites archaeon]